MDNEADQEDFGEASLGEAQSEQPKLDPEMLEDESEPGLIETSEGEREPADVPALEPLAEDATLEEAVEDAALEGGEIGGPGSGVDVPEAERPLAESGQGQAEGFEDAERGLIEAASHGDPAGNPLSDRPPPEERPPEDAATTYGEPDREKVSEDKDDDHN